MYGNKSSDQSGMHRRYTSPINLRHVADRYDQMETRLYDRAREAFMGHSGGYSIQLRSRSNCTVFVQNGGVRIDLHKNATKTEVFENAIESGYPQNGGF